MGLHTMGTIDQPSIAEEREARAAQCAKLAELFKARPLAEIEPDELKLVTPHYQQRISELRRKQHMRIVNVPRSVDVMVRDDGGRLKWKAQKRDGAYMFTPHEPLGRDAGQSVPAPWNQDRPWAPEFRLTPPE